MEEIIKKDRLLVAGPDGKTYEIDGGGGNLKGTYNLMSDLGLSVSATKSQIASALATAVTDAGERDYCNVEIPADGSTPTVIARTDIYKYDGTEWYFDHSKDDLGDYVSAKEAQDFSTEEKAQARNNIGAESADNKVTSLSAQSTDTQYPSAKCVFDMIGNIETLLAAI